MIVLDTNVVSEPLKLQPDEAVLRWFNRQEPQTLFISAVTLAELLDGVGRLPKGRRRDLLDTSLRQRVLPLFAGRILAFDEPSAEAFARIRESTRSAGTTIGLADATIAATAMASGFAVASRDTAPFLAAGLELVDPWSEV